MTTAFRLSPVPFSEAIRAAQARVSLLPGNYYQLPELLRNRAFTVTGLQAVEQIDEVLRSLQRAMQEGTTFSDWKKTVTVADLKDGHASTVFRTNTLSHQNAGRWAQQALNANRRPYLMYDAVNDSRTRPSHAAMDGIIKPVGDTFWKTHYPPNGFNCRCQVIALTQAQAKARGGVTKVLPDNAQADAGWFSHPGTDYDAVLAESLEHATPELSLRLAAEAIKNTKDPITAAWFGEPGKVSLRGAAGSQVLDVTSEMALSLARSAGGLRGAEVKLVERSSGFQTLEATHPLLREPYRTSFAYGEDGVEAVIQNLVLNEQLAASGLGTRIVATSLTELQRVGVTQVALLAAGKNGTQTVGYYVWPKLGFNATLDWVAISERLTVPDTFRRANTLQDLYKLPGGEEWWYRHGEEIAVTFDLAPGSASWVQLQAYLNSKGIQL